MQSKRLTTIEVLTNTFTGLIGSWLISVWYISGNHGTYETATMITILCTVWSILRGYVIRRIFNRIGARQKEQLKGGTPFADLMQFNKDIAEWKIPEGIEGKGGSRGTSD